MATPQNSAHDRALSEIGERRVIEEHILPLLSCGYGNVLLDDCAILDLANGPPLLLSADQGPRETFLELLDIGDPSDVGHFHVTACISDIAAMGGVPIGILLVMAFNATEKESHVAQFMDGVAQALKSYGASLLGGDTKQARSRSTTVTVVGRCHESGALLRSGARPGDPIFITPETIGSILENYVSVARARRLGRPARPKRATAKIAFGQSLAASRVVTSCMDMSDGLISSAAQLGQINRLAFAIDIDRIPLAPSPKSDRSCKRLNLILNVGGEFGLLFTTTPEGSGIAKGLGGVKIGEVSDELPPGISLLRAPADVSPSPWEQFTTTGSISDALLSFV